MRLPSVRLHSVRAAAGWGAALLVAPAIAAAQSPAPPAAKVDVPVKTVMLFSSGVGYFEHAGRVRDSVTSVLRFKTSQINDILKSLVIVDQDGGKISGITYPSQDPLAKTLRSFQVDITRNPSMADLLNQLRGARVTVQLPTEKVSGTVIGVETQRRTVTGSDAGVVSVLNLFSGANIRSVELPQISNLALDDAQLQDELTKALSALSQSRDQDKKPVAISFAGTGERRVRVGYVVETPIWKTSYRLLLDDKASRIQGWAIVENQTDSDWNGVALSLVSGRPLSFTMDLYQPLHATRPVVTQELYAGLRPQQYDAGIAANREGVVMEAAGSGAPGRVAAMEARAPGAERARLGMGEVNLAAVVVSNAMPLVPSVAAAAKLGELFQYAVSNVTLARQKSALFPIIADSIAVERVSIYNASVLETNPLNGVRVTNTTGKHLLQGPVTVLNNGGYAGDAQIDNLPPGQQRLLSFGIDLDVRVDATTAKADTRVLTGRIAKGLLTIDQTLVTTQEYRVDNKGSPEKLMVIEHPITEGAKLVDTQRPLETTDELYRFQGKAPSGKVTTLLVREERVQSSTVALLTLESPRLMAFAQGGDLPRAVRDAIVKAANLKNAVAETDRQIAERTKQLTDIAQEQNRLRENMRTVVQSTPYYTRLLEKLNEQESTIESIQRDRGDLQRKRDAQREEFEAYVSTLSVG